MQNVAPTQKAGALLETLEAVVIVLHDLGRINTIFGELDGHWGRDRNFPNLMLGS